MWILHVQSGWHQGVQQPLKTGIIRVGADEGADILLLDPYVPSLLLELELSDSGALACLAAAETLVFSYDGDTWTPVRPEPLFSVNLQFRFGDLYFSLIRDQASPAVPSSHEAAGISANSGETAYTQTAVPLWILRIPGQRLRTVIHRLYAGAVQNPRMAVGLVFACLLTTFIPLMFIVMRPVTPEPQVAAFQHPSGLTLSYALSADHQAPPGMRDDAERVPLLDAEDQNVIEHSAGIDAVDRSVMSFSALRLSYALTTGKPLDLPDRQAEPAVVSLRDHLAQLSWGSRVVLNAAGNRLTLRAQLSESERKDFERILQRTIREYGRDVAIRAVVDPLEPVPEIQIKQVLGGDNPVIVLQDGSRLMQGSFYDGKLVESITTDRLVLRGKDRIEIPI